MLVIESIALLGTARRRLVLCEYGRHRMNKRAANSGPKITPQDLAGITRRPSSTVFVVKTSLWASGIACGLYAYMLGGSITHVLGALLLGAFMAHGVELSHQALHGTGLRGKGANRFIGVILATPMLVSYSEYRLNHLHHHQALGTPEDREFWIYSDGKSRGLLAALRHLLIINHYAHALKNMGRSVIGADLPNIPKEHDGSVRGEYLLMLLLISIILVSSISTGGWSILGAWLVPLILAAGPIHALVELPEHYGCDKTTPNVFRNTRSIKSNWFMTWFTNGNNFHVEHHAVAGLPMEQLRSLHNNIKDRIEVYNNTYTGFYVSVIRQFSSDMLNKRKKEC